MSDINFTDNSGRAKHQMDDAMKIALKAIGIEAEGFAKDRITAAKAVVTGRLRNSITYAIKENEGKSFTYSDDQGKTYSDQIGIGADKDAVYVGTNVVYAPGIELGTHRKAGAVHFLQDAATGHSKRYKELAKAAMESFRNKD